MRGQRRGLCGTVFGETVNKKILDLGVGAQADRADPLIDWSKLVTTGPGRLRCCFCGCQIMLHPTRDSIDRLLAHWRLHAPEEADRFLNFLRWQPIAVLEDLADLLHEQGRPELFRRYSSWSATSRLVQSRASEGKD
jgi:hypothetical protein